ncbi:CvpA family protein [Thiolapillus sp.]
MMDAWLPRTLFDWVVILYLCWSLLRGWRRGFYPELHAALSAVLMLALLAGFSLTRLVWQSLDLLISDFLHLSRLLGLLLLVFLSAYLLWKIRRYLSDIKKKKSGSSLPGMLMGLLQAVLWVGVLLTLVRLLPFTVSGVLYSASMHIWRHLVGLVLQ